MWATGGLLLLALLAFVVLVAASPHRLLYDEPYFANNIALFHKYGLTAIFINSLAGAAGPLYPVVHVALEPLTPLQPVGMRLVNVLLLVAVAGMLAAWLKRQGRADYGVAACSVLIVPMTWVVAGMALTEMPAMAFVTLSLYLQLRGLAALEAGRSVLGWFIGSGVCLGIAVWGRQPYLLLCGVPVLVAILERRLRMPVMIFAGIVMGSAIPLFLIWKGLVPPSEHAVQQGISVTHGLISLGYTGICFLLLVPRSGLLPAKLLAAVVVLTGVTNALVGALALYPVRSVAARYLPAFAVSAYGNFCGSLFLSCGAVFLILLLRSIWEGRGDLTRVTVSAGLLCMAASPVFLGRQYSSRYTAMSLPYLVLAAQPWRQWTVQTLTAAVLGCGMGFLSLLGYFSH